MNKIYIDRYVPNYEEQCMNCDQSPTVEAWLGDECVNKWEMCGPCTFGTARALDVDWWNSGEE